MWKIAICQENPKLGDLNHNMNLIRKSISKVSGKADLIIFPELMLTGYDIKNIIDDVSQTPKSPYIRQIKDYCKQFNIYSVISFIEDNNDNKYISALLINNKGETLGIYRKTHLFGDENNYIDKGNNIEVYKTDIGNIGIMICYDLEFPEVARTLALKGADYILVPTANMNPYNHHQYIYAQSRTFENEVPIVVCNRVGKEGSLNFFGESIAVNTNGDIYQLKTNQSLIEIVNIDNSPIDNQLNYLQNRNTYLYNKLIDS